MPRLIGILLVALSAAGFGTLAIFTRYATEAGASGVTILFFRFTLAALVMCAVLVLRREPLPRGPALARLVLMGAAGYFTQSLCYVTALNYASAGLVALLLYLYPVFVAALSVVVLKERLTPVKGVALALAVGGAALTVGPEGGGQWQGIALAVLAAAIYSVYILIGSQVMKQVSVVQSSSVIMASAAASFATALAVQGPQLPARPEGWAAILGIVVFSTLLPIVTFLAGLERIGPTNASMLSTLEPVVTVLLAVWLFAENLAAPALLGGALILAAVLVLTRGELRRNAEPESARSSR